MALDNTKTITAVTYNGNDWTVGGGGGPLVAYGNIVAGHDTTQIEFTGSSAYSNYLIALQPNASFFVSAPAGLAYAVSFSEIQGNKKIFADGFDRLMGNLGDDVFSKNGDVITLGGIMGEHFYDTAKVDYIGVFW